MRLLLLLTAAALSLCGQVQTFNNGELNGAVRAKINASLTYLDGSKAGISACAGGTFAIRTSASGVNCLAVDWSVLTGVPPQFGNVLIFSGAGSPGSPDNVHPTCTAPNSSLNIFIDTTHHDQWWCYATNSWLKLLSVTNAGPYEVIGATGTAPTSPASGSVACYFDSTTNTQVCLDSSGNPTTMVREWSGTAALGTSAIASQDCATVVTATATGVTNLDSLTVQPSASIKAVTGYAPLTTGALRMSWYLTSDTVNFDVCNPTSSSITPGAVTLVWKVIR